MYYPLLRARQFELIALRELAIEGVTQELIIPILEPVKKSQNNLILAHRVFEEYGQNAYLIVNPIVGEITGDNNTCLDLLNNLGEETFGPAFHYRDNSKYIFDSIKKYKLNNCLLLCQNDLNAEDKEFRELASSKAIALINLEDPGRNRALHRFIGGLKKTYIRLDDLFEKQRKNSVFLNISAHRFSEEHLYYDNDGFSGFSDYTVLPSEYVDGGITPRAVVIHLTYLNGENQIWIRHFTSDTNDTISNVQGKFAEAAAKAVTFCRENNLTNSAIEELESYYDSERYPGLGTIKKLSIKNHLLVVAQYLRNR